MMGIMVNFNHLTRELAAYLVDQYSEKVKSVEEESNRIEDTNPQ